VLESKNIFNSLSFRLLTLFTLSFIAASIYFLYRDNTIIFNQILSTFHVDNLLNKKDLSPHFPLPKWAIYSLPGGIWVFVLTTLLNQHSIWVQKARLPLDYLPITYGIILEFFQFFHITNGTFDFVDILFVLGFGVIALSINRNQQELTVKWQTKIPHWVLVSGFLVLILSDVHK
jgi:hypothetical protein